MQENNKSKKNMKGDKEFDSRNLEKYLSDYEITWMHKIKKEHKNKYYTIGDFKKYLSKNDKFHTQKDLEDLNNYTILGFLEINTNLKEITAGYTKSKFFLFIIVRNNKKECCLSVSKLPPALWYRTSSKNELKDLLDKIENVYNPTSYNINFTQCKSFLGGTIGSLGMDLIELESMLLVNNNTEILTWGSAWKDYPFRNIFNNNLSKYDKNSICVQASRQHPDLPNQVNIRTLFSKSLVKVENYNGSYIFTVWYNPIENNNIEKLNRKFKRSYQSDFPTDLLMTILSFEYQDYLSILKTKDNNPLKYIMTNLLINTEEEKKNVINHLKKETNDDAKFFLAKLQTKSEIEKNFVDESFEDFVLKVMFEINEKSDQLKEEVIKRLKKKFEKLDLNNKFVKKEIDYLVSDIVQDPDL